MHPELKKIIDKSESIVFFGGAGVSTESNIPDFRSESGLYNAKQKYGYSPETMLSHSFYMRNPELFYKYYKENLIHLDAEPNDAHKALARLEQEGKLKAVITQNIDGLHQKAGSKVVYELHGSVERNRCESCGKHYYVGYVMNDVNCENMVPYCECGGRIKPEVVLYEEPLDSEVIEGAISAIESCDTLIIGGTSLAVYPAAGFIHCFRGDNLVLINKTPTSVDSRAQLVINDSIGKVLKID